MKEKEMQVDKEVESGKRAGEREEGEGFWKYFHITEKYNMKNDLIFSLPVPLFSSKSLKDEIVHIKEFSQEFRC